MQRAERHALLLATRQLFWLALQQLVQTQHARGAIDRRLDVGFRGFLVAQAKGEIVVHAHVLVERIVSGTPSQCRDRAAADDSPADRRSGYRR